MSLRLCLLGLLSTAALAAAPSAAPADLTLISQGTTLGLSAADIAALPHQQVSAFDAHEKATHVYSGVPVRDLLVKVGAPLGEKLRGPALRMAVLARSKDGYEVVYALAEFDDAFSSRTILLVDGEDGKPLGEGAGPLRLVVPGDKRPARWIRSVVSLGIISLGEPRPPKP